MLAIYKKVQLLLSKKDHYSFYILIILVVIEAFLEMVGIGIIPIFIGTILFPDQLSKIPFLQNIGLDDFEYTNNSSLIYWSSAFLFVFFTLKTAYTINNTYLKARYANNIALKFSERLYKAYLNAPYNFHLSHGTPELMRNINGECTQLANLVILPMINIISQSVTIVGIIAILTLSVPQSVLFWLCIFLLTVAISASILNKRIKLLGKEAQDHRARLIQVIKDGLEGVKEIKLMQRTDYFARRLSTVFSRLLEIQRIIQVTQESLSSIVELVAIGALLAVIVMLYASNVEAAIIIPIVTGFVVALARLKGAVRHVIKAYTQIRHASVSLDIVHDGLKNLEVIQLSCEGEEEDAKVRPGSDQGRLSFINSIDIKNLWFKYPGAEGYTLQDISFSIKKGEAIGFVGSTGAGKSTLVDNILGILQPTTGEILVDEENIQDKLEPWQRNLGYIPQMIFLVDGTMIENVALGVDARKIDYHRLNQAVEMASLMMLINKLPEGMETIVGERGVRLSGGERQRIAIARALYLDPYVLVMDEATSALDNLTEVEIIKAVDALKGDRTILLIAHRLSTVRHCDRIVFLKEGVISAIGSYHELVEKSPEFRLMASTAQ